MPKPHDDEVVIFRDFFTAGLRFPVDLFVFEVLIEGQVSSADTGVLHDALGFSVSV